MSRRLPAAAVPVGAVVRIVHGTLHGVEVVSLIAIRRVVNSDPETGRIRWEGLDSGLGSKTLGDPVEHFIGAATVVEVVGLP